MPSATARRNLAHLELALAIDRSAGQTFRALDPVQQQFFQWLVETAENDWHLRFRMWLALGILREIRNQEKHQHDQRLRA